jgi:hypothetical protein
MKHHLLGLKKRLIKVRKDYDELPSKTKRRARGLPKNIKKMEDFQKVLLNGVQDGGDDFFSGRESPINDVENIGLEPTQNKESLEKGVKIWKKLVDFLTFFKLDEPPKQKIHGNLSNKRSQVLWDSYAENLRKILHDISLFKGGSNVKLGKGNSVSLRLQKNVLETIDYMYRHKMITKYALQNFCQNKKTLEISAYCKSFLPHIQEDNELKTYLYLPPLALLNEWHSDSDRRFCEG